MKYLYRAGHMGIGNLVQTFYVGIDFDEAIPRKAIESAGLINVEMLTDREIEENYKVTKFIRATRFQRRELAKIGIEV